MKIRKRAAHSRAAQKKARNVRAARKIMKAVLKELEKNPDPLQDDLTDPSLLPLALVDRKSDTERL